MCIRYYFVSPSHALSGEFFERQLFLLLFFSVSRAFVCVNHFIGIVAFKGCVKYWGWTDNLRMSCFKLLALRAKVRYGPRQEVSYEFALSLLPATSGRTSQETHSSYHHPAPQQIQLQPTADTAKAKAILNEKSEKHPPIEAFLNAIFPPRIWREGDRVYVQVRPGSAGEGTHAGLHMVVRDHILRSCLILPLFRST